MIKQLDMLPEVVVPKIDENRRYTTRAFMHFITRVAGVNAWDLDPAADQESHHAPRWFSLLPEPGSSGIDGLARSWLPPDEWAGWISWTGVYPSWRIFINPPFDDIGPWLGAVWQTIEYARGLSLEVQIAFVLPGNRTEQGFWQDHVEPFLAGHERENWLGYQLVAHSPRTRQFYGHPGNPEPKSGQAEWPSVVLVWRRAP